MNFDLELQFASPPMRSVLWSLVGKDEGTDSMPLQRCLIYIIEGVFDSPSYVALGVDALEPTGSPSAMVVLSHMAFLAGMQPDLLQGPSWSSSDSHSHHEEAAEPPKEVALHSPILSSLSTAEMIISCHISRSTHSHPVVGSRRM